VPAFYAKPKSLDDIVTHIVGRVFDLFDIEMPGLARLARRGEETETAPLDTRTTLQIADQKE
jgi:hypothetical protein